jgi:hypothetical protein
MTSQSSPGQTKSIVVTEESFLEVSKVWPIPKPQEIFVCYEGGEAVRSYSISRRSKD